MSGTPGLYPQPPVQEGALSLDFPAEGASRGLTHRVSDGIREVIRTVTQTSLPWEGGGIVRQGFASDP